MGHLAKIEELSKALKPVSKEEDADAAVTLLLKPADNDFKFLIVKRAKNPADPWSGQMAFPGGKRDSKDQNLKQTVVRETLEETGINLLDRCRFLGVMETMRSIRRPEMRVLPFVVFFEHEQSIKLNEELVGYSWISLRQLVQHEGIVNFSFGEFPAYIIEDNAIWGLTYRILKRFVQTRESH